MPIHEMGDSLCWDRFVLFVMRCNEIMKVLRNVKLGFNLLSLLRSALFLLTRLSSFHFGLFILTIRIM